MYLLGSRILNAFHKQWILAMNLKHSAELKIEPEFFEYPFFKLLISDKKAWRRGGGQTTLITKRSFFSPRLE